MSERSDTVHEAYWTQLTESLRQEIAATGAAPESVRARHALHRVLGDRLGLLDDAAAEMDLALDLAPEDVEILWEAWRLAARRDVSIRPALLERIADATDRPRLAAACHLAAARILGHRLGDRQGQARCAALAREAAPGERGVVWTALQDALAAGDDRGIAEALAPAIEATADPLWKATLLVEVAHRERRLGAPAEAIAPGLEEALSQPGIGWSILDEIQRTSAEMGLWEIHERAMVAMADGSVSTEPEAPPDRPPGHAFDGFERSGRRAAAVWWLVATVRERRLGDVEGALEAVDRARGLCADHPLLDAERARLLERCGRVDEAMDAVTGEMPAEWGAMLALCARRADLAAELSRSAAASGSSFGEILSEIASSGEEEQGVAGPAGEQGKEEWLLANPGHPDAPSVAADLIAQGRRSPIARLCVEETSPPSVPWPPESDAPEDAAWSRAVGAVLGVGMDRAHAYASWGDEVSDDRLRASLLSAAARAAEDAGEDREALALCERALEIDPVQPTALLGSARLMRRLGMWSELVDRLAVIGGAGAPDRAAAIAAHERALVMEHALDDRQGTSDAIAEVLDRDPEDAAARWTAARLAFSLSDWDRALHHLERVSALCPEDAPLVDLVAAEILLLALGRADEAAAMLERAAGGLEGPYALAARLYALQAHAAHGDAESFLRALLEERERSPDLFARMLVPDALETGRALRGPSDAAAAAGIEGSGDIGHLIWRAAFEGDAADTAGVSRRLLELAGAREGGASGLYRVAALLLGDLATHGEAGIGIAHLEDPEVLWHVADRLPANADPSVRAEVARRRSEMCRDGDAAEWADWALARAEALEDAGRAEEAISVVREGLERVEDHPGLLEARARLAAAVGSWAEAADTHGRLARLYASDDEKATQLSVAASVMLEKLDDANGAERVVREAVRRAPSHEIAHEVLDDVLRTKGDEEGLARAIEEQIDAEYNTESLVQLYQEQADRLLAVDDTEGALEAIEQLLFLDPANTAAHRTKIDLEIVAGDWESAVGSMLDFKDFCEDPSERRNTVWRAVKTVLDELGDSDRAVSILEDLSSSGDRHPQTERYLTEIYEAAGRWEEAAVAWSRLAALTTDVAKRTEAMRTEAKIRLEQLFDDEGAERVIEEILVFNPKDVETVKLALEFKDGSEAKPLLASAEAAIREDLRMRPVSPGLVSDLREVAELGGDEESAAICSAVLSALAASPAAPAPGEPIPAGSPDTGWLGERLIHPDEARSPAARVAGLAAMVTAEVFGEAEFLPRVGRGTLVGRKSEDAVKAWLEAWASALGVPEIEVHRTADAPAESSPVPREIPAIAVASSAQVPLGVRERFFMARNLWRSARGLGGFREGDATMPVRWVLALATAALGDGQSLPMPTDRDLVDKAKKQMPRKIRKRIAEPCRAVVEETPQAIRAWISATSYTADRVGLLAAGQIEGVIPLVVEESAGPNGLARFRESPAEALDKIPRCVELLRFAFSPAYPELLEALAPKGGGTP